MATTTYDRQNAPAATKPAMTSAGRCGNCGCVPVQCTCCELVCFERPDYHCGHLLTDADLSLQVRYVVEKNKLRNRTLHGHGVVCGLKLTCDPLCDGIVVHDGYAIDDCGNDIVVCEPTRFDVIAALKAKHLIVPARDQDRCDPRQVDRECHIAQCFYVTVCYAEEDAEFQTPFQAGCASGPQDCVPTRIKERYRFDVSDERPPAASYIDRLEKKLRHCYRLFLDSPVGRLIAQNLTLLTEIADGQFVASQAAPDKTCEIFCLLKAQFQQQLKAHPDELSCRLARDVAALKCPDVVGDALPAAMASAFSDLFELMHRYQYDCVLADVVFACATADEACCVLLGSVQVEDGYVVRVNNTPRSYVWSFANIVQVLTSEILTAATAAPAKPRGDEPEPRPDPCCPTFNFDQASFLREFAVDGAGRYLAATAPLRAMRAVHEAMAENFAFTDSTAFAPTLFAHAGDKDLSRLVTALGLSLSSSEPSVELAPLNPMQALMAQMLTRRDDSLRLYPGTEGTVRRILPDYEAEVSPERGGDSIAVRTQAALAERDRTIADLTSRLDALQKTVDTLTAPPPSSQAPGKGKTPNPA